MHKITQFLIHLTINPIPPNNQFHRQDRDHNKFNNLHPYLIDLNSFPNYVASLIQHISQKSLIKVFINYLHKLLTFT